MTLPARILNTGAAGNLGAKLAAHSDARRFAADRRGSLSDPTLVRGANHDYDRRHPKLVLRDKPDRDLSVWDELTGPNVDAVLNAFEGAARAGVKPFVFASSNHVMGG